MARSETRTTRASEPANPCVEIHGDGTQIVRHHLGLTIYEEAVLRFAAAIVASPDTSDMEFDEISERAIAQADSLLSKMRLQS